MTKAIRIHRPGGPEVFSWDEIEVGRPGRGEALIRQTAVGLNFIDTYYRSGMYALSLPAILGAEGAGVVEAVAKTSASSNPATGWPIAGSGAPIWGPMPRRGCSRPSA